MFAQNTVSLDSTFGVNGKVSTTITPEGYYGNTIMLVQDDGKIIVGTNFSEYPVLVRYLPNGDLDTTWGQNGSVHTPMYSWSVNIIHDILLLDNGQIIITGTKDSTSTSTVNYLIKYNIDGSLDANFGNNGIVYYINPPNKIVFHWSALILNSNIILVANDLLDLNSIVFLAFNLTNGLLDANFGSNGLLQRNIGNFSTYRTYGRVINNKILVHVDYNKLCQFTTNFQLDSVFGFNGFIESNCSSLSWIYSSSGNATILEPFVQLDGKLIMGGLSLGTCNLEKTVLLERFLINGEVDSSFAQNGVLELDFRRDSFELNFLNSVDFLENGYILVSGGVFEYDSSEVKQQNFTMALFDSLGNPISTFGNNGVYIEPNFHVNDSIDWLRDVVVQDDGKVLLCGFTPHYNIFEVFSNNQIPIGLLSVNLSRYYITGIESTEPTQTNDTIIIIDTVYITDTTYVLDTIYNPSDTVVVNDTTVIYDTITVYDTINTNIRNVEEGSFSIYPNPALNNLFIKSEIPIEQYVIYDYLGKAILQNKLKEKPIDISRLSNGVYIISFITENGNFYHARFVKE